VSQQSVCYKVILLLKTKQKSFLRIKDWLPFPAWWVWWWLRHGWFQQVSRWSSSYQVQTKTMLRWFKWIALLWWVRFGSVRCSLRGETTITVKGCLVEIPIRKKWRENGFGVETKRLGWVQVRAQEDQLEGPGGDCTNSWGLKGKKENFGQTYKSYSKCL